MQLRLTAQFLNMSCIFKAQLMDKQAQSEEELQLATIPEVCEV